MNKSRLWLKNSLLLLPVIVWQLFALSLQGFAREIPAPQENSEFRFSGEYGLWVQEVRGRIEVHWITAEEDSGFLRVLRNDKPVHEFATPFSLLHQVSFEKPGGPDFTIHYGSLRDPLDNHKTVIQLAVKRPAAIFGEVDSLYVLGDLHGQYDRLVQLLSNANIIDANLDWIATTKHLVILGDIFDRGHHVTKILWLLYQLERQAELAGGRVHVVLGNHEIMTFDNDLSYTSPKERLIGHLHRVPYPKLFDVHHSILGKWLATKPGLIKIENILFAHGGVTPFYADYSIKAFNDTLRIFLDQGTFADESPDSSAALADSLWYLRRQRFLYGEDSVFWHRGYVIAGTSEDDLEKVLNKYQCTTHVIAHTIVKTISEYYDGKVIAVDLIKPATEMLLLVSKGPERFKIHLDGTVEKLQSRK